VIADNRYGLYSPEIPCVFITHQLTIKSPLGKWTEKFLQKKNYRYINYFDECWVPDEAGEDNLAGELSHPLKKPAVPIHYIGILSRFEIENIQEEKDHLLIILSGPEPQRSLLEKKIIKDASTYRGTATIVRGLPGYSASFLPSTNMVRFYNHLESSELNKEMQRAEYIVSRTGYSTIMDVMKLRKKTILIPTPGQTEQKYLSDYLLQKKIAFTISGKDFSLMNSLQKAKQFFYHFPTHNNNEQLLQQVISSFISSIKV
jgi:predicted glycosyltransferase